MVVVPFQTLFKRKERLGNQAREKRASLGNLYKNQARWNIGIVEQPQNTPGTPFIKLALSTQKTNSNINITLALTPARFFTITTLYFKKGDCLFSF